ncbi:Cilia- and flagella-associated protein 100 [Trebouxia sp. C0009 RCD-2024]
MSSRGSQLGGTILGHTSQPVTGADMVPEDNPFALPSDEEIFMLQDVERQQRAQLMATMRSLPVHLKSTFSSQIQATVVREVGLEHAVRKAEPKKRLIAAAPAAAPASTRRPQEKENMNDFIAKKREIFLVQMSLDTKRAEITKLEERALQREEALKKSEQMLEEDALRFDAFLKENDEKVQEAIKKAEVEAKAKQDKVCLHPLTPG